MYHYRREHHLGSKAILSKLYVTAEDQLTLRFSAFVAFAVVTLRPNAFRNFGVAKRCDRGRNSIQGLDDSATAICVRLCPT